MTVPGELMAGVASGMIAGLGAWWWVREHAHPQYVTREEFALLRALIRESRESVLREIQILRESLDKGRDRR